MTLRKLMLLHCNFVSKLFNIITPQTFDILFVYPQELIVIVTKLCAQFVLMIYLLTTLHKLHIVIVDFDTTSSALLNGPINVDPVHNVAKNTRQ